MFLIAGLGNPEKRYKGTRHNIGFDVIDAIAEKYHIAVREKKHRALCGSGVIEGVKVVLAKPVTYMNLSGESVAEIVNFYKLDPESEMLIIFDDVSLAPGNIRVRKKGSAGGHNGVKSIIANVGTDGFMRIKVGVGERKPGHDLISHVLGRMDKDERKRVDEAVDEAVAAAVLMIQGQVDKAMNDYNAKKQESDQ